MADVADGRKVYKVVYNVQGVMGFCLCCWVRAKSLEEARSAFRGLYPASHIKEVVDAPDVPDWAEVEDAAVMEEERHKQFEQWWASKKAKELG